uniref:Radical SAM domain protein n=1 Tax=uncultured bacterium contig00063 TaxID=1181546 RepID=A0A806JYZ6_9BACT|nr:radical SAM domain protein [uncultured bacterium contig00063]
MADSHLKINKNTNEHNDFILWYKVPMRLKEVKGILNANGGMNISRGCTHGCIYCDSRSRCYHIEHDFEDVEIKSNAPELLEDALKRKRKKAWSRRDR